MFRGTFTALVTPFRDGEVDVPALEALVEGQIADAVNGVIAVGTTGESPTLSAAEREQVIRVTVEVAKGKCQVLAGTGSNSTSATISATRAAEKMGVDGMLVVAPYYNKPSQEGLFRHFQAIAQATASPLILYNIPGRCAVETAPETAKHLPIYRRKIVS